MSEDGEGDEPLTFWDKVTVVSMVLLCLMWGGSLLFLNRTVAAVGFVLVSEIILFVLIIMFIVLGDRVV